MYFLAEKVVKNGNGDSDSRDETLDGGTSTDSPSLVAEGRARDTPNNNIAKEVGKVDPLGGYSNREYLDSSSHYACCCSCGSNGSYRTSQCPTTASAGSPYRTGPTLGTRSESAACAEG